MGKIKVGVNVRLGAYGLPCDDDWKKSELRDALVGRDAIVVEILTEKDRRGCRQVIVETNDGIRIDWRVCSLIFP